MITGRYVDPKAGLVTFSDYAEDWRKRQVHRPGTVDSVERALRLRVYKRIGGMRPSAVLPSHVQALVSAMSADGLAPATIAVTYRHVSTIFRSAVADKRIQESPCVGVKLPRVSRAKVVPLATETVLAVAEAMPARYHAMVVWAAATGLRQGEVFAVTVFASTSCVGRSGWTGSWSVQRPRTRVCGTQD